MTTDQSLFFAQNGFLHLPSFIHQTDCQKLILRMHELAERLCPKNKSHVFEAGYDRQSKDDFFLSSAHKISFFFDKNADQRESNNPFALLNKVGHALHNLDPVYKKFSHQEKFYELLHELGHKKPFAAQSMFIFKQSKFGDEVPAHQDATFLYTEPNSVIGLWFALQDADEDNGCLWVLPGGHRGKLKNRFVKRDHHLSFENEEKVLWPRSLFIPVPAKAGDAVVLHGLLPHLSDQNRSPRTRFAYSIHFIDQACHYPKTNWLSL